MEYVLIIAAFIWLGSLASRVTALERHMKEGVKNISSDIISQPQSQGAIQSSNVATVSSQSLYGSSPESEDVSESWLLRFWNWLRDDWLLKLGAFLILIGFGWFVTYAFLHNWIGPMGRIAFGLSAGALISFLGWWRIKTFVTQGSVFLVLGSTVILLTTYAAREIYNFFTPSSALLLMFLSAAFVALSSVKYNRRSLALSSVILAGIAPLLTQTPTPNDIYLFWYLLIITLGSLWIVILTKDRLLTLAALILVSIYSWPYLVSPSAVADIHTLLLFAYGFSALFFVAHTIGLIKRDGKGLMTDLVTAGLNGLFLFLWVYNVAPKDWQSLIISAWMMVFMVGAFVVTRLTRERDPFYIYAGVGVGYLAVATAMELNGAVLTIAYITECALITLLTHVILNNKHLTEKVSLLFLGPIFLSFSSIISYKWNDGVLHDDFFVLLILSLVLFGLGLFIRSEYKRSVENAKSELPSALVVGGSIYAYILLWLSLHAVLLDDGIAVMISLAIYTIIGVVTYIGPMSYNNRSLRIYGGCLLAFVVLRLLIVDAWAMELTGRIVIFFLVGVLLVSTAFLNRKKVE